MIAAIALASAMAGTPAPAAQIVDDFEGPLAWTAHPADGVAMKLRADDGFEGRGMRIDFGFAGGGYAIARRGVALDLPENYELSFRIRGEGPPNTIEFKLVDASGENVWWSVRRDVELPAAWDTYRYKKRHITYAWGPQGGGTIRHVAALEIVVTAGSGGGEGSVWIDDLALRELPPASDAPFAPRAFASSAREGRGAPAVLDRRDDTVWTPRADDAAPWIALDLGSVREFGGLELEWAPWRHASDYRVEGSEDGRIWTTLRRVREVRGGVHPLFLPESDARFVRIVIEAAASEAGVALRSVSPRPPAWSASREAFYESIARGAPRGAYPRGIAGEQAYWTVVGGERDGNELLLGEDGAIELGKGMGSVEPFLRTGGRILTWADARIAHALQDGELPIPTVTRDHGRLRLDVTAFDVVPETPASTESPGVAVRYRLTDSGTRRCAVTLLLAVRPFQVNPPSQQLNLRGGSAPIRSIEREGDVLLVNGAPAIVCATPPSDFGAVPFGGGDAVDELVRTGRVPDSTRAIDPFEAATGVISYELDVPAGESRDVAILVAPRGSPEGAKAVAAQWRGTGGGSAGGSGAGGATGVDRALAVSAAAWRERLGTVSFDLPEPAASWARAMRSQIAFILVNRDGPAIQPGARSYARSWIRDGALTSSAMLRVGRADVAREFLAWFAPHQYAGGKIPCVVDSRGADPVPEHDSHGEFIYLAAEIVRFTKDRALAEEMFPRVLAAAAYLDSLRATRRTPEFADPAKREFWGLLPPSISHEGYSAKPMHSYWDDFFAVRGFRDAAFLAAFLGRDAERRRLEASAVEFEADLAASVPLAMEKHGIEYVPGCADLGDYDATSTTIALEPTNAARLLPEGALEKTFDGAWDYFEARRRGEAWEAYTPYEFRTIGSLVRLGERERALTAMAWYFEHRRPPGWNAWPEVVRRDEREAAFLGDLPHTWVGSDFMRSFLDLFAYEDEARDALVVGAGVDDAWLERREGIAVHGLQTRHGELELAMRRDLESVVVTLGGGMDPPAGGIRVRAPGVRAGARAAVDGKAAAVDERGEVAVHELPATVRITR